MASMTWQVQDLILAIFDMDEEQLDVLSKAVRNRRQHLRDKKELENQMSLYVGDRIRISASMKSKWMNNRTGVVEALDDEGVLMRLDTPYQGKNYSTRYTLKLSFPCVEKIVD